MRISRVVFPVPSVASSLAFWRDVLGLPVEGSTVRVGSTELELVQDPAARPGTQHLAIDVPGDAGLAARDWLRARTPLLARDGEDLLESSPAFDACSVYFEAGDGTVLELIARRRLPDRLGTAAFGAQHLLRISEVGVPVASVPQAVSRLGLGVLGTASATFAAAGDDGGMLILVAPGRAWFPTREHVSAVAGLEVVLSGTGRRGGVRLNSGTVVSYA
ncbi:VOC family protein [Kineococcus rhizosphaerae]|uniref:Catechol-2,3-dioxygenase n=1 Tax=Kineococcus rhizosphaerae TaxID=559628 RepID=A0A2T0QYW4_9ACTN|nr:VOC family protein [Kineococcus rhizosphaerae]PRY11490.1 catechol-2,3-dioxygenase [Kineococcus rhizosphaerae]